jgi:glycosyltransferase involved in cell wall biosynthesis
VSTVSLPRRVAKKIVTTLRPVRPERSPGFVLTQPNPSAPDLLPSFRFFAVLGTWMEEDIVESTVRNAFVQGVEKVFLVDNASTDATVERAVAAGAQLAESFRTVSHQEELRNLFMNAVVARESIACGAEYVWWLWIDADEFPEGPGTMTIAEYLATLDRRFRLVGSTYYNHFPTTKPENIPGVHPVDLQPMCEASIPIEQTRCAQPHWKHPLQRFDRQGVFLKAVSGFHTATLRTQDPLYEPEGGIVTHHIQYRDEAVTRARYDLCDPSRYAVHQTIRALHVQRRRASLDAVYAHRFEEIDNRGEWKKELGVSLTPWPTRGPRWYESSPESRPAKD